MKRVGLFLGNWIVILTSPIWAGWLALFAFGTERQFREVRKGERWFFNAI